MSTRDSACFLPHGGPGLLVGGQLEGPQGSTGRLLLAGGNGCHHRPPSTLGWHAEMKVAACSLSRRSPLWRYSYMLPYRPTPYLPYRYRELQYSNGKGSVKTEDWFIQYGVPSQAGINNIIQRRHYMELCAAFTLSINHFASRYIPIYPAWYIYE